MASKGKFYEVGRGKPPRKNRFKPGRSANPKGRPKGSKNFATVLAQELNDKMPITENGRSRKVSKREVIAKQWVNKAAGGDLKAGQAVFKGTGELDEAVQPAGPDMAVFDTQQTSLVIEEIVRRIRAMNEGPPPVPPAVTPDPDQPTPPPTKKRKEPKS
jgi:hypothetical protein